MRMSAKSSSTYTGFEPIFTKEMIEVREACPGECKDRKSIFHTALLMSDKDEDQFWSTLNVAKIDDSLLQLSQK